MSSSQSKTGDKASGGPAPKHRACDECRTRKLACSKEPDGCARCKRENIVCHYSAQKPMGRPRKRPREDEQQSASTVAASVATAEPASKSVMVEVPPDTADPGLAFLNMLASGGVEDVDVDFGTDLGLGLGLGLDLNPTAGGVVAPETTSWTSWTSRLPEKSDWHFGKFMMGSGQDISQLNLDPAASSFSQANLDPALFMNNSAQTPTLSSDFSSSPDSSTGNGESPPAVTVNVPCACTASLYLAIDSMQKLSSHVTNAIREARLATKAAYEVVNCPTCSILNGPPTAPPKPHSVMQNFQNLMLLATLIPSIVHAYQRILIIVDQEAAKAKAERREIAFTLERYGGVWGGFSKPADKGCDAMALLGYRMMEPTVWRLTVRALLKVDIYGMESKTWSSFMPSEPIDLDPFHLGLKDLVVQMENRSKARHAIMDPLILSGSWTEHDCALKMHKTGEKPTCAKIIEIARTALDNLVIA